LRYCLDKANEGGKIRSSIPYAIEEAKKLAVESDKKAKEAEKTVKAIGIGGAIAVITVIIALIIALVALVFPSWQLQNKYIDDLNTLRKENDAQDKLITQLQKIVIDSKAMDRQNDNTHQQNTVDKNPKSTTK
jgi:uncharacterized protein HemX